MKNCLHFSSVKPACLGLLFAFLVSGSLHAADPAPTPEQLDFFENKIRPILVNKCYRCHSEEAEKLKGNFFIDTKAGLLAGGDSGPSIVSGDPKKSILIDTVKRLDEDLAMPPKEKEKLTAAQIADLEKWVKMGAPDPRTGAKALSNIEKLMEEGKTHWAFQAVKKPALPAVKAKDGLQTEVDHFIMAGLEAKGLNFSKSADPRTLLRRVYYDLIGLPPTMEQIAAFEKASEKNAQAAYTEVVDKLLKSPRYGERWGRHWLDVARYADNSGGYGNVGDGEYTHAHTYRDYVIRSFNEDKPYDQFVIEQLAADHLNLPKDDNRALAAMGFLTVGFKRGGDRGIDDDVTDDQIDTISRGLLAMSVGCARCHDHKLEPIPTRDYYSLYGILRSSMEPAARPELKPLPETPELAEYKKVNDAVRSEFIRTYAFEAEKKLVTQYERIGDYLLAVHDGKHKRNAEDDNKVGGSITGPRNLNGGIYDGFVASWDKWVKGRPDIFRPWLELSALSPAEFAAKAPALCKNFAENKDKSLNPSIASLFKNLEPTALHEIAWGYNSAFASIERQWGDKFRGELKRLGKAESGELSIPLKELSMKAIDRIGKAYENAKLKDSVPEAALMQCITAEGSPFALSGERFLSLRLFNRNVAGGVRRAADEKLKQVIAHPGAPPQAMVLVDAKNMYNAHVFIRGNAKTKGIPAPRQFFEVLAGTDQKPFPKESSGRLEFAKAVIDPKNPLTARVIVNRVWQWHFGEGLVRTPSDFGFRGEKPTHPELLDYLTARFVEEGWSLKKLHRWMLLSTTYQQSSIADSAYEKKDPDNRLWRRMNSRPLEFEPFRDTLLSVSGRLDLKPGGRADDIIVDGKTTRRTVYAKVDRKTFPNLFRIFDFPPPSFAIAQRKITTLTPLALYMLNSPFIADNAKALAKFAKAKKEQPQGIADLYRRVLRREPNEAELASATKFLAAYPKTDKVIPEATDWLYGYGEFNDKDGKVAKFTPLAKFSGDVVKGVKQKDMDLSGMEINAKGGKVAKDRATIRRWTAPYEGTVNVYAELLHSNIVEAVDGKPHPKPEGDGVFCYLVHNGVKKLGNWSAFNSATMTLTDNIKVKPGDTLDFVTLCGDDSKGDTFTWAPTITMKDRDIPSMKGMAMRWDAQNNFMDPSKMPVPIGPWEELAQVLLLSNEFAVVD